MLRQIFRANSNYSEQTLNYLGVKIKTAIEEPITAQPVEPAKKKIKYILRDLKSTPNKIDASGKFFATLEN